MAAAPHITVGMSGLVLMHALPATLDSLTAASLQQPDMMERTAATLDHQNTILRFTRLAAWQTLSPSSCAAVLHQAIQWVGTLPAASRGGMAAELAELWFAALGLVGTLLSAAGPPAARPSPDPHSSAQYREAAWVILAFLPKAAEAARLQRNKANVVTCAIRLFEAASWAIAELAALPQLVSDWAQLAVCMQAATALLSLMPTFPRLEASRRQQRHAYVLSGYLRTVMFAWSFSASSASAWLSSNQARGMELAESVLAALATQLWAAHSAGCRLAHFLLSGGFASLPDGGASEMQRLVDGLSSLLLAGMLLLRRAGDAVQPSGATDSM